MPGTWLPSLVWEDPTCYGAIKPVCHNYWSLHLESRRRQWHPLQYSCLENPMGGGAWWAAVHGVAKSQTRLSNLTFTFHFHALEKEMAVHSSILAWRIPGTGEPGGLLSMGSHRVRHDWSDAAAAAAARRVHSLQQENHRNEKLHTATKSSPCSLKLQKSQSNKDPAQPKIHTNK